MGTLSLFVDARPTCMAPTVEFAELYHRYSEAVYGTALRVTGNRADAEDALQTVFLRILNRGNRIDPAVAPERYLRRSATNAALDILRRRASRAEAQFDDSLPHRAESPALLKEQLRRAIAALEQRDAEMFVLRYVEGLSNGELAELFGIEKTNVAVRLHRIRQTLQAEMGR